MANEDLSERVLALEAKNSTLRIIAVVALVLALLLPVGAAYGAIAYVKSITPTLSLEVRELRAKRVVVLNESRKSRGTLRARGDTVDLALGSAHGAHVALRAGPTNALARLRTSSGSIVYATADMGSAGMHVRSDDFEARLEAKPVERRSGLVAQHRSTQPQGVDRDARFGIDRDGMKLAATTWALGTNPPTQVRQAELAVPEPMAPGPTTLRLEQRGGTIVARVGGTPRIDLRRGGGVIWQSPIPTRPGQTEEDLENDDAGEISGSEPTRPGSTQPRTPTPPAPRPPAPTPAPTKAPPPAPAPPP